MACIKPHSKASHPHCRSKARKLVSVTHGKSTLSSENRNTSDSEVEEAGRVKVAEKLKKAPATGSTECGCERYSS
ncbi:unnamed protein product [Calypogeia fissa]